MKRIGIIGGMSYESTLHYYKGINDKVNERLGGLSSADLVLRSVDFEPYHKFMKDDNWSAIAYRLRREALDLVLKCNCDYVAIATNTMHKVAENVIRPTNVIVGSTDIWPYTTREVTVPLVHIGDCVAEECKAAGVERVILLGTKFTMTEDFMKKRLEDNGLTVVNDFPEETIERIDHIIFDELCHGRTERKSAQFLHDLCNEALRRDETIGIILGCTELEILLCESTSNWVSHHHGVAVVRDDEILRLLHGCNFAKWVEHEYGSKKIFDTTEAHINRLAELCVS